jgi:hypothetical protein
VLWRADVKWHAVGSRCSQVAMNVVTAVAFLALLASSAGQTPVEARKLVCFGNEPSWSARFDRPGQARVILPSVPLADYQERDFLKALESATRWTVDGGRLDMHRADDERALTALPTEAR